MVADWWVSSLESDKGTVSAEAVAVEVVEAGAASASTPAAAPEPGPAPAAAVASVVEDWRWWELRRSQIGSF